MGTESEQHSLVDSEGRKKFLSLLLWQKKTCFLPHPGLGQFPPFAGPQQTDSGDFNTFRFMCVKQWKRKRKKKKKRTVSQRRKSKKPRLKKTHRVDKNWIDREQNYTHCVRVCVYMCVTKESREKLQSYRHYKLLHGEPICHRNTQYFPLWRSNLFKYIRIYCGV